MQPEGDAAAAAAAGSSRAAFTLAVVHARRDERRITAVALLRAGQRVFVGLDNGVVEEHARSTSSSSASSVSTQPQQQPQQLRLLAEKRVFSRAAVADISPADAAGRLVVMSDEGAVSAAATDSVGCRARAGSTITPRSTTRPSWKTIGGARVAGDLCCGAAARRARRPRDRSAAEQPPARAAGSRREGGQGAQQRAAVCRAARRHDHRQQQPAGGAGHPGVLCCVLRGAPCQCP
jgi:hypothetical protein